MPRTKIKPFVKAVNFTHVMPTRYQTDMDLKETVTIGDLNDAGKRQDMRKAVKKIFEAKYLNQTEKKDKKAIGAAFLFDKMQF